MECFSRQEPERDIIPRCATTTRGIIRINGDDAFTSANGVVGGDGSSGNPYVITGWEIDAGGGEYCVSISSTSKYYTVANCTLKNARGSEFSAGIYITIAPNGTVDSNIIIDCARGIYIEGSKNAIVTNNSCSKNQKSIYLAGCQSAQVKFNHCTLVENAIYLTSCTGCTISDNVLETYLGFLYWGPPIYDNWGTNNDISNNTTSGVPGPLDVWAYFLLAFLGASFCVIFTRNRALKKKESNMATPGKWKSPWNVKMGIIFAEFGISLTLPFALKIAFGIAPAGVMAYFYTFGSSSNVATVQNLFLLTVGGLCLHFLLEIIASRKAHQAITKELPKQCQESWEVKDLVRGIFRRSSAGLAICIICGMLSPSLGIIYLGFHLPAGILFLLPAWVFFRRVQREGETQFKAECVALFKSNPERAFAANLDQEFEAWASGGKEKGGKIETLPVATGQEVTAPVIKPVTTDIPVDPSNLFLQVLLQLEFPNKGGIIEAYKNAIVTGLNLDISPVDLGNMKGEQLASRLAKALREGSKRLHSPK